MKEMMADPSLSKIIKKGLSDPKWKGWVKRSNKNSNGVEIHFNAKMENGKIIAVDNFKFIDP